jgi:inorganic pyrophosphatase
VDPGLNIEEWAGRSVEVVIDRPLGSRHPRHPELVMELNYGYLPGTRAPDGHPLDAYVLGADVPLERCTATVIAIVRRRDDIEDKVVTALSGEWDEESIARATAFQESWFDTWVELP